MNKLALIAGLSFASFAVSPAAILWSQLPTSADGFFSDGVTTNGGQFYEQAIGDNFTIAQQSTVTQMRFWGSSENFFGPPDLSNFSAWDIQIFDPAFTLLFVGQPTQAMFTITATGNQNAGLGNEYKLELDTNFVINPGSYFLHVGSINVAPQDDAFVWSEATADGTLAGNFFDGLGWQVFTNTGDVAFELEGSPVPEPASMFALGLGAAALAARRRRKTA